MSRETVKPSVRETRPHRREEFAEFRYALGVLAAELLHGPEPELVLYLRCGSCGRTAPSTVRRDVARLGRDGYALPTEYQCGHCGAWAPRGTGDEVDLDDPDDPDVETITITCTGPAPLLIVWRWRRCDHVYTAPATAVEVRCPRCGHRHDADGDPA